MGEEEMWRKQGRQEKKLMQEDQFKPNTIGAFRIGELELPRS
jgi:hypothetical protein